MATVMDKAQRLAYLKECAQRIREEKQRDLRLLEEDPELAESLDVNDLDYDDYDRPSRGITPVRGGLRHLPVFIL